MPTFPMAPAALLQVSVLSPPAANGGTSPPQARHWFTATPDPQRSIFKPFLMPPPGSSSSDAEPLDGSPATVAAPAPRNPPHQLWQRWQGVYERRGAKKPPAAALRELEAQGLDPAGGLTFAAAVEEELRLYGA